MAKAVTARQQGDQFQARIFWVHASSLLHPDHQNVVEVCYEADEPRGFDDIVVRYDPPHRGGPNGRVSVHHYQIKFHVVAAGRFGYADLVRPEFSGGKSVSILERLAEAKAKVPESAAFTLVTTDRIADGDPLLDLLSRVDRSLRLDKLFVKGGDRSRMGKVRKAWRERLGTDDEGLRKILTGLRIHDGHKTLEEMRDEVNDKFRVVGLATCADSIEFRYDGAAIELKVRGQNNLTRDAFRQLVITEQWLTGGDPDDFLPVAIRSFSDGLAAELDAAPDYGLSLLEHFDGRYLRPGATWDGAIGTASAELLERAKSTGRRLRLTLNAHSAIAFLAGTVLGLKSGANVELVQRGRAPTSVWRADDGRTGPPALVTEETAGSGADVALIISLSRNALADVRDYAASHLPEVGHLLHVIPESGPGQGAVAGGAHAAALADQSAEAVRAARLPLGAKVHVFVTGPNAFSFFLGQHRAAMGPTIFYEYDFERRVHGTYEPTFRID